MDDNTSRARQDDTYYEYYPLDTDAGHVLLAEDHEVVVNPQTGWFALVNWERRQFVTDCSFTAQECVVLMALLDAWPSYVPMDKLRRQADPAHEQQESEPGVPHPSPHGAHRLPGAPASPWPECHPCWRAGLASGPFPGAEQRGAGRPP